MNKFLVLFAVVSTVVMGAEPKAKTPAKAKAAKPAVTAKAAKPVAATKSPTADAATAKPEAEKTALQAAAPAQTATDASPATTAPAATTTETVAAPASKGNWIGAVEMRPSYSWTEKSLFNENSAELGYSFSPKFSVSYNQDFNNNLYTENKKVSGAEFISKDGFLRAKVNNIWKNESGMSLSWEPRVYAPTRASFRDAGMVTMVRNYLKLSQEVTKSMSVTLSEIPILHAYTRAGEAGAANPIFENRVYLSADWTLFEGKVAVSIPVMFHNTRHRAFAKGAKNNDAWEHVLWVNPEVDYAVSKNYMLGVAYYSDNLLKSNTPNLGFGVKDGLNGGVVQAVLRASL